MTYIRSLFLILFFIYSHFTLGQNEIKSLQTQAKIYFESHEYHNALKYYLKLDSIEAGSNEYDYYIGVSYVNQLQNEKAIPYLERCLEHSQKYPRNLDYYAAKAYQLSHRFDDALIHYDIYQHKLGKSKKNKKLVEDIEREIACCEYAKELVARPVDVKILNMEGINSPFADYGPVLTADQNIIIFTSTRPNTLGGKMDDTDGRYFEDIYISYKTDTGWSAPKNMGPSINTEGHDASIGLSPDGQKLLLFRYNEKLLGSGSPGDLYISRLRGNSWTQATKLSENINTKALELSACFSADGRSLFFSSNREDGKGGFDLYMVKKLPTGEWAMPMNMGSTINTPYDEDSPFIHPDGKTLYFSSTGHRTMGGYDIFVSRFDDEKNEWSRPENIGYPLNTAHDDIHFSWTADGVRVYFSSIRPGGKGDNDIYYADLNKEKANVMVLKGVVLDSTTKAPIEAAIKVYDNRTNEVIGVYNSNSVTGKYILVFPEGKNYSMTVEANKYKLYYENINIEDLNGFKEKEQNIFLNLIPE